MDTIIKTVKQYSYELDNNTLSELKYIGNKYRNVKNYVYSRYSGINSITLIEKPRDIRDNWIKTKFYQEWKLPARYWKLALSEALSNIKTAWTNIKSKIKIALNRNKKLSEDDTYYIRYILKCNNLYHKILTNKQIDIPKIFENKDLNYSYLNSLIKRLTRKYKGKISYSLANTFSIDTGLYSYKNGYINITCTTKGKRLPIKLSDNNIYNRTMIVKIIGNRIEIHCPLKIKTKKNSYENIIGIDKGYKYLFAVSSGNFYGSNLNNYLTKETERLNKVNSCRNRFYALRSKYLEQGKLTKVRNIEENNLGKTKYNRNKNKYNSVVKSYINHSINRLIINETPKEIIMEDLTFVSWNNTYPKEIKRKISRWIKGYIRERLEYKCDYKGIKYTYINPAYTSKVCNICNNFGIREGDKFICLKCGELHADINASKNILKRKNDKEINLYTNYKKVKEILEERVSNI